MSILITKKTLEYLAELSRIELNKKNEEKLLKSLQEILTYFEKLKEVNVEDIKPMAGGTIEKNVFREDGFIESNRREISEYRGELARKEIESNRREISEYRGELARKEIESNRREISEYRGELARKEIEANWREKNKREPALSDRQSALTKQFPEKENGFLKVPAVFE